VVDIDELSGRRPVQMTDTWPVACMHWLDVGGHPTVSTMREQRIEGRQEDGARDEARRGVGGRYLDRCGFNGVIRTNSACFQAVQIPCHFHPDGGHSHCSISISRASSTVPSSVYLH
jgi:hypothetical protein